MAKTWNENGWVLARLRRNGAGAQTIGAAQDALEMGIPATEVYTAASGGLDSLDRLVDSYNVVDVAQPAQRRYQAPALMRRVVDNRDNRDAAPVLNGLRALLAQAQARPDPGPMQFPGMAPDFSQQRVIPVAVANPAAAGPSTATSGLLGYQVYRSRLFVESGGILTSVDAVAIDAQPIAFSPTGVAMPGNLLDPDTFHQGCLWSGDVTAQVVVGATASAAGRWNVYLQGIPSIAPRAEQYAGRGCGCPPGLGGGGGGGLNLRALEDLIGSNDGLRQLVEMLPRG